MDASGTLDIVTDGGGVGRVVLRGMTMRLHRDGGAANDAQTMPDAVFPGCTRTRRSTIAAAPRR